MTKGLSAGLCSAFRHSVFVIAAAAVLSIAPEACGGDWPRELKAYRGTTPKVDGVIEEAEWQDATRFEGVEGWTAQFTRTTRKEDLSLTAG